MGNRKLRKFSSFCEDSPPSSGGLANVASGANIAGLSPDIPPVPVVSQRKKSNIRKRKKRKQ